MPIHASSHRGTWLGLLAVILWSAVPPLIRLLSENFGPIGGAALMYSVSAALLAAVLGWPRLRDFPPRYLLLGGGLFACYEIALALALGFAQNRMQAIELGIVNYLWPCFTVLMAVAFNRQRAGPLLLPGLCLSLLGVAWIMSGGALSPAGILRNALQNPLSYSLALAGALLWAAYCTFTKRLSQGKNGIAPFFALTALALWLQYGLSRESLAMPALSSIAILLLAAVVMAAGYAAWNIAIAEGNMMLLVAASYSTPVLSSALASAILSTALSFAFWQGAAMVAAGSLLCWRSTRPTRAA
ncbi:aromatic amino acid DMT transporter YddG [Chromobacterium sphagni]|uniref:Aromatic amino acid transporter n=1 Tax=Chromobacterium sphagni TaxID=1903179 RepID=A0ABX3C9F2_9NEIS|nr:aromatic amino acid DMT transporter YddG [Chromobacterium sphagni]OHX18864.1 aromatic amino acid transporter [Chromobacterium sphagni]